MPTPTRTALLALALAAVTLAGCAPVRRDEAASTEKLLAAAGFRVKPADTPEHQKGLAAMPPLKMVQRIKDGNVVYTYADPYNCKCLYVGNESNYQEYRRLGLQQQIAQENLDAAEDAEMDWGLVGWDMWGPW